jgi:hypothetical protein
LGVNLIDAKLREGSNPSELLTSVTPCNINFPNRPGIEYISNIGEIIKQEGVWNKFPSSRYDISPANAEEIHICLHRVLIYTPDLG